MGQFVPFRDDHFQVARPELGDRGGAGLRQTPPRQGPRAGQGEVGFRAPSRDLGPGQYDTVYPASVTGGNYVGTYNDNVVVIAGISTVAGISQAKAIAAVPGIHALYLDRTNLESDSGYPQGSSDYNKLAQFVQLSALASHKYLCTADRTTTPNTLTCSK